MSTYRYLEQLTVTDLRRSFESFVLDHGLLDIDSPPARSPVARRKALNKLWIRFIRRVTRHCSIVDRGM